MAKDTFYFSHDYNARNDSKVKKLISKYGLRGYGIFWSIIEDLYNNANALPEDYECIAFDLREDMKIVQSVVKDFDLFVFENGFFGSLSVQKRLEERNSKSVKARESALKRWNKDANALQTQSDGNAIKERKGKERKINIPTLQEFLEYIKSKTGNYFHEIESSSKLKYEAWVENGWKDGNDEVIKNWKSKLLHTIPHLKRDPNNKPKQTLTAL